MIFTLGLYYCIIPGLVGLLLVLGSEILDRYPRRPPWLPHLSKPVFWFILSITIVTAACNLALARYWSMLVPVSTILGAYGARKLWPRIYGWTMSFGLLPETRPAPCRNCQFTMRMAWAPTDRQPILQTLELGDHIALKSCDYCEGLWVESDKLFLIRWDFGPVRWTQAHQADNGHTLRNWHNQEVLRHWDTAMHRTGSRHH